MKEITNLWSKLNQCLIELNTDNDFVNDMYDNFDEIFDLKEVQEYKNAAKYELYCTPDEFTHISFAIKRAFVEGYLLAQAIQRKQNIKDIYNCYKKEINYDKNNNTNPADNATDEFKIKYPCLCKWYDTYRESRITNNSRNT